MGTPVSPAATPARAGRVALRTGGPMAAAQPHEITRMLIDASGGNRDAFDKALARLAEVNDEACQLVECRYFGGLTLEEAAAALGLSVATARRRWDFAKAWLRR